MVFSPVYAGWMRAPLEGFALVAPPGG